MIVWVASWPRSGNTMFRSLLHRTYGLPSYSLAGRRETDVFGATVSDIVGHVPVDWSPELADRLRGDDGLHLVKTHEPPTDGGPAIYVVRDGRAAAVSYHRYLRQVEGLDVTIEAVVDGRVYAGGWSEHVRAWDPLRRPDTVVARFEDLCRDPGPTLAAVARLLGLAPRPPVVTGLGTLRPLAPAFFGAGDDAANIGALGRELEARFLERHGAELAALGYLRAAASAAS